MNSMEKINFFYLKVEIITQTTYENGWPYYWLEFFKNDMIVLDSHGKEILAKAGTLYLVPPGKRMVFKSVDDKLYVHSLIQFYADDKYMNSLNLPYMTPFTIENDTEIEHLLFEMNQHQVSTSPFKLSVENSYLNIILHEIYNQLNNILIEYTCKEGDDLRTVRLTMMNSPGYNWNIESMSRFANLSPGYF